MNRFIPRSWGESFVNVFLDLSKDISHFSSSTYVDRQFLVRRYAALGYRFRNSHGGTGCRSAHQPYRPARASVSNRSSVPFPGVGE